MTPLEYASASLHFGLALILFWLLCFHFWRQYRVDLLREKLFKIRADLFDYAAKGGVSFGDPVYGRLRVVMNGMIRFAHKFTFTRVAIVVLFRNSLQPPDPLAEWREAVSKLPDERRKVVQELHDQMLTAIVWHVTTGSPILLAVFLFYVMKFFASGRKLEVNSLPAVDVVEAQAINAELHERHEYPSDEFTLAAQ